MLLALRALHTRVKIRLIPAWASWLTAEALRAAIAEGILNWRHLLFAIGGLVLDETIQITAVLTVLRRRLTVLEGDGSDLVSEGLWLSRVNR